MYSYLCVIIALQKLLYTSVFPVLCEQLDYPDMLVLVLPCFLGMIQTASDDDYKQLIQPEIKRVFQMTRPVQVGPTHGKYRKLP